MKLKSNASKIELKLYDDLFETDESRAENALAKIRDIPLSEIDDFPDHPFKVRDDDEDMTQLTESIKERGIITPATVRLKEDGRYELISGHRRKRACELAGMDTLKAEVKELSRDDAVILMVDSNLQRSTILPSERAFSYKMRLDAMKRQGERSDLTSSPMGTKLRSDQELAHQTGESRNQIQRYVRLTYLTPEILEMVDEKKIAFRPAVELSFLSDEHQQILVSAMEYHDATPSLAQAIKMRDYANNGSLNQFLINDIMKEEKPNQRPKPSFDERITKLIPKNVPKGKESDFVVKAIQYYNKHLQRNNQER
ncbi:MAG: ParB/RepB/Spo0J family partition protein [Clostridia bacterium]|nr:ParB/RepB/Spo0J family partition protein [Clostridia bacterium]